MFGSPFTASRSRVQGHAEIVDLDLLCDIGSFNSAMAMLTQAEEKGVVVQDFRAVELIESEHAFVQEV